MIIVLAPATGVYGAPTFCAAPTPAFGAAPAGAHFGGIAQQQKPGSLAYPYQQITKQDGNNNITLHSITAMQQFESKSFEELRLEDYLVGNKGSQGQQTQAPAVTSGFGATAPAPAFGAPQEGNNTIWPDLTNIFNGFSCF